MNYEKLFNDFTFIELSQHSRLMIGHHFIHTAAATGLAVAQSVLSIEPTSFLQLRFRTHHFGSHTPKYAEINKKIKKAENESSNFARILLLAWKKLRKPFKR